MEAHDAVLKYILVQCMKIHNKAKTCKDKGQLSKQKIEALKVIVHIFYKIRHF